MNKISNGMAFIITLLVVASLMLGVIGCSNTISTTTSTQTTTQTSISTSISTVISTVTQPVSSTTNTQTNPVVLTVKSPTDTKTFTMEQLKALPVFTGSAGQMSSTGHITGPSQYTGVKFSDILDTVGGITENNGIRVTAKDDYSMTFSYNQLTTGANFTVIDGTSGNEVNTPAQPVLFRVPARVAAPRPPGNR